MTKKEMRATIVNIVASFCEVNNLIYRDVWRSIYQHYEDVYHLPVATWYKMGQHKDKLSFLEAYEELYSTLTKMYKLVKDLK
jgi:hypothetical protein